MRCSVCALESVNLWLKQINLKTEKPKQKLELCAHGIRCYVPTWCKLCWARTSVNREFLFADREFLIADVETRTWFYFGDKHRRRPHHRLPSQSLCQHLSFIELSDGRRHFEEVADFQKIGLLILRAVAPIEAEGLTDIFGINLNRRGHNGRVSKRLRKSTSLGTVYDGVWACHTQRHSCNQWASGKLGYANPAEPQAPYPRSQDAMQEHRSVRWDPEYLRSDNRYREHACEVVLANVESQDFMLNAAIGEADDAELDKAIKPNCMESKTREPARCYIRRKPVAKPPKRDVPKTLENAHRIPKYERLRATRVPYRRLWRRKWKECIDPIEALTAAMPTNLDVQLGQRALRKWYDMLQSQAIENKQLMSTILTLNARGHRSKRTHAYLNWRPKDDVYTWYSEKSQRTGNASTGAGLKHFSASA